jgi:two-component system, OmpR family, phosphate regulon response regulator PhoB
MNERILVVEDDEAMSSVVRDALTARGYKVTVMQTAETALVRLSEVLPDLLVLDIRLKGLSGLQLCEILKKEPRTASLPIILLTSLAAERDKVSGLRTGADDYVTKPFSVAELTARVEALLRRAKNKGAMARVLKAGRLEVHPESREAVADGEAVHLTRLEFDLLSTFLDRPGLVHSHEALGRSVWGEDRVATSHTVTVTVSRLKEKLGKAGAAIEAVPGVGYRLKADA